MKEENMDMDLEAVYKKLIKGLLIYPVFKISPTDEDYCESENLLRMGDDDFCELCRKFNIKLTPIG